MSSGKIILASTNSYFLNLFSALVNKGNCLFASGDYEKAREYYQEAYNVEASCTEALFNLGMSICSSHNLLQVNLVKLSCRLSILLFRNHCPLCYVCLPMSVCSK